MNYDMDFFIAHLFMPVKSVVKLKKETTGICETKSKKIIIAAMDSIYNYTCTSCGLDISVSSIENLPPACPRCKCIDWVSESSKIEIEWRRKWEQRRYELAKELLLRINMSSDVYKSCIGATTSAKITAALAEATVKMADAIIEKLITTENIFYEKTRTKPK